MANTTVVSADGGAGAMIAVLTLVVVIIASLGYGLYAGWFGDVLGDGGSGGGEVATAGPYVPPTTYLPPDDSDPDDDSETKAPKTKDKKVKDTTAAPKKKQDDDPKKADTKKSDTKKADTKKSDTTDEKSDTKDKDPKPVDMKTGKYDSDDDDDDEDKTSDKPDKLAINKEDLDRKKSGDKKADTKPKAKKQTSLPAPKKVDVTSAGKTASSSNSQYSSLTPTQQLAALIVVIAKSGKVREVSASQVNLFNLPVFLAKNKVLAVSTTFTWYGRTYPVFREAGYPIAYLQGAPYFIYLEPSGGNKQVVCFRPWTAAELAEIRTNTSQTTTSGCASGYTYRRDGDRCLNDESGWADGKTLKIRDYDNGWILGIDGSEYCGVGSNWTYKQFNWFGDTSANARHRWQAIKGELGVKLKFLGRKEGRGSARSWNSDPEDETCRNEEYMQPDNGSEKMRLGGDVGGGAEWLVWKIDGTSANVLQSRWNGKFMKMVKIKDGDFDCFLTSSAEDATRVELLD